MGGPLPSPVSRLPSSVSPILEMDTAMREMTDVEKVRKFMRYLGAEARGKGRIYLVGGSSAVLLGWGLIGY